MGFKIRLRTEALNMEKDSSVILANFIEIKYLEVYSIRAGHFKQIARILKYRKTDYDPEYIEKERNEH